jgi:predicted acylesterase/phospholipase RssA
MAGEHDESPYNYEVSNEPENRLLLWEAARSTSAAPTYFEPFVKANRLQFWDGGLITTIRQKLRHPRRNGSGQGYGL